MYRCNLNSDKDPNGYGFHSTRFQECPWLWLAKIRIKDWINNDKSAFRAYIEDLSTIVQSRDGFGFPRYKIVWEWTKHNKK